MEQVVTQSPRIFFTSFHSSVYERAQWWEWRVCAGGGEREVCWCHTRPWPTATVQSTEREQPVFTGTSVHSITAVSFQCQLLTSQMSCGKKYYMKYLTQFSVGGRRDREGGGNKTPLRAEGDTAFSRTSFDAWKIRQQEKLEK